MDHSTYIGRLDDDQTQELLRACIAERDPAAIAMALIIEMDEADMTELVELLTVNLEGAETPA